MSFPPISSHLLTYAVTGAAILGILTRPFRWPEAIWVVAAAFILVAAGLLPPAAAWAGIAKGLDVYLFLTGMMALAEVARREGLFDVLAAQAVRQARGKPERLFALIYGAGLLVTVFLSNDATAVVLTPAVYAAAKAAQAKPLPYLFICAFIANAASFVLPISNPANLVVFGDHMPALWPWLVRFGPSSAAAIVLTFILLRWSQRHALRAPLEPGGETPVLPHGAKIAAGGIAAAALGLILASAFDWRLGGPACAAGLSTAAATLAIKRETPWTILKDISWSVLPLVAGLFVLVEALERSGVLAEFAAGLTAAANWPGAAWGAGAGVAVATNLVNNLPAGLLAGAALQAAHVPAKTTDAILIGIDLGPNLSVTGSLATILWLTALRREGEDVSFWTFLKLGFLVMPPALVAALAARALGP